MECMVCGWKKGKKGEEGNGKKSCRSFLALPYMSWGVLASWVGMGRGGYLLKCFKKF